MYIRTLSTAGILFLYGVVIVHAAINLDGTQAVDPLKEGDPSPIGDLDTYYPDQHDCPLPCLDYGNIHSWITYLSTDRLTRCKEAMLLQFSATLPLDDPTTNVLIRSCTLTTSSPGVNSRIFSGGDVNLTNVDNPKKSNRLSRVRLGSTSACSSTGTQVPEVLEIQASGGGSRNDTSDEIAGVLLGFQKYFITRDNCDENFAFAFYGQTVASIYIGSDLAKPTALSAIKALMQQSQVSAANRTIVQRCGLQTGSTRTFGVAIDTTGDLAGVQEMAANWAKGNCVSQDNLQPSGSVKINLFNLSGPGAANNITLSSNSTLSSNGTLTGRSIAHNVKRATCRYIQVVANDGCGSLVSRCGISAADFTKFNPKANLCSTLQVKDYVCCSAGDPYTEPKPDPPKPGADGVCATHLIQNGDTCDSLSKKYGVTIDDLERWNKFKTWAWTECKAMLLGYNMCVSSGDAALPPSQAGTECGPLVPGTQRPANSATSIADLNPCPLKACCSNWGYCGVFPAHCDVHTPLAGGPGSVTPGFLSTCVSNCGVEIKLNSAAPAAFQRIGYYESYSFERDCLWLKAKNANTDGSYTHIHWAFADIDPATWKPVIKESSKGQWAEFKALKNVKRIVSLGGWAASTEPATYNIIRSAIISNRNLFASNLATFAKTEGIDGIDIDWEYPGAPDILVGGEPIGKKTDGLDYLKFLTILKQQAGTSLSVSIAAPASYWYLKGFPIDRIAAVIDYIVYMTYDLHGQWDYGNPNAYDKCDSGKCIRSHVNLTETRNSLSIITKAGVANSKIFVGEASYGRSFRMATDGCWGPMCEFTGSRTQSDAHPGRCTKTGGYLGFAEINELIRAGGVQMFHDGESNTDIILYQGDYVSYMTPTTKETRRADWKGLNFAGSIDWAVDLQSFTADDMAIPPDRPTDGEEGCVEGEDMTTNSGDLCEFSCSLGFCPTSLCRCTFEDVVSPLPDARDASNIIAWDESVVDLNRLCLFGCKYGYCPDDICTTIPTDDIVVTDDDDPNVIDYDSIDQANMKVCQLFKDRSMRDASATQCYNTACKSAIEANRAAGLPTNWGCIGRTPLNEPIPWTAVPGKSTLTAPGMCFCNNYLLNELATTIAEALPIIAQIGCYILMSAIKIVMDIGVQAIPGVGKGMDAGLDMATTAAQMAAYAYPEEEDPEGAFSWWLSPCGGTNLVPEELKKAFNILSTVAGGVSNFKVPKNVPKGSGKKGDEANPTDRAKPKPSGSGSGKNKGKCTIPKAKQSKRTINKLVEESCVDEKTVVKEWHITSVIYAANAVETLVAKPCKASWPQACHHYRSAISINPSWATLTCPPEAGATQKAVLDRDVVSAWRSNHRGNGWKNVDATPRSEKCGVDEYPPIYMLSEDSPAYVGAGTKSVGGQLARLLPGTQNSGAASMWKSMCFNIPAKEVSDRDMKDQIALDPDKKYGEVVAGDKRTFTYLGAVNVRTRPKFTISSWPASAPNDGLNNNPCWPSGRAPEDPAYALIAVDPYYTDKTRPYDYTKPYVPGQNGV